MEARALDIVVRYPCRRLLESDLFHPLFEMAQPGFEIDDPAQGLVQQTDGCFNPLCSHGIRDVGKRFVESEAGDARPVDDLRTQFIAYRIDRIRCRIMVNELA
jgi:hypothetical protein